MITRKKIAVLFERLSDLIFDNPIKVLAFALLLLAYPLSQMPDLYIDTSNEGFFHKNDPILQNYNAFLDEFDRDELAVIVIETPDVFDKAFLKELSELHKDLENNVPELDEVISLINVTHVEGRDDELVVEDLLENPPRNPAELQKLRQKVLSHPIYPNMLISEDGTVTTVLVRANTYQTTGNDEDLMAGFEDTSVDASGKTAEKLTPAQISAFNEAVRNISRSYERENVSIKLAGLIVVTDQILVTLNKEMPLFTAASILFIALMLFILYRRISGVALPLLVVITSLIFTVGLMASTHTPFTVFTQILPSFLLAVGVGDSVHVLTIFFRQYAESGDKRRAMRYALGHAGLAMLMTSVTTAAGLLSFAFAEIAPIGDLGIWGAIGVMSAFFFTVTVLPALVALLPIHGTGFARRGHMNALIDGLLVRIADFSIQRTGVVFAMAALLLAAAGYGISQLRFEHEPVSWFPKDHDIRTAVDITDDKLRGAMYAEIVIDSGVPNGVKSAAFMHKLDELNTRLLQLRTDNMYVGKTNSIVDTVKSVNKALNENRNTAYAIPDSDNLISQEILLFENSGGDDLERQVDPLFQKARLTMKLPWTNAGSYEHFLPKVQQEVEAMFGRSQTYSLTGMITLFTHIFDSAIRSMEQSYIIAAFVIGVLMMVMLSSVRLGLVAMIPNLFPIVVALGAMGLADFPLDISSILVGSIAIGLCVDDTIHFMHHFRSHYGETGDAVDAVHKTLQTAGRAMLFTSIVLACGFFVFALSIMNNLVSFGIITGITIIIALLADIMLAPALMVLITKRKILNTIVTPNVESAR